MYYVCSTKKKSKKGKVSRFHHESKIIKSHLVMLEKQLCDSHLDEKRFEENVAVTKIQENPNYFTYSKKFSICKTDIGPLMNRATNSLSNDKH